MKNYKNEKLQTYFEKYVSKMKIDKKFKPYIVDILLRRAYQYNLTPQEIQTDVSRLQKTLKKIEVVDKSKLGAEWASAEYSPYEKTIRIASQTVEKHDDDLLYQTLTHEVYHALSHDIYKNPVTGKYESKDYLADINSYTKEENYTLLETIVEKSSYKTVFNSKTNNAYYNKNSYRGYTAITFVLDAIEAVYGVNEQALLRNGIQSREQLVNFLSDTIGEDSNKTKRFLDGIEMNLSLVHKALYPPKGENISYEEKVDRVSNGLTYMKNICMQKLNERIVNNDDFDRNKLEEIAFDFNKINAIFDEKIYHFDRALSAKGKIVYVMENDILQKNATRSTYIRIKDLNKVITNVDQIPSEVKEEVFNFAKNGNLSHYDETSIYFAKDNPKRLIPLSDFGISPTQYGTERNRIDLLEEFNISGNRYNEIVARKNDNDKFTEEWDNRNIGNIKKDFKPKISERIISAINKIKNVFDFKKQKKYQLPEGRATVIYGNNSFDERYRADENVRENVVAIGREFEKKDTHNLDKTSKTEDLTK